MSDARSHEPTQERTVKVEPTGRHYSLLVAPNGGFLGFDGFDGSNDSGASAVFSAADDRVMWERQADGFLHAATGRTAQLVSEGHVTIAGRTLNEHGERGGDAARFAVAHGPERLPSEYLRDFKEHGWVCLACILAPEVVDDLQRVACTDGYAAHKPNRKTPQFSQSAALARTAAEPVSLWVIRQYMHTDDISFAHTPALIVLTEDDGQRNVQGWHSDYPYHWGVPAPGKVPAGAGGVVLGVQRNVCVSAFTRERGATAFKLGSHALNSAPPEPWGSVEMHARPGHRAKHGLPYNGPEADVIEAPAGSIILYDARTWHRAGVNRTPHKRAAMLQAVTPMFVMPKNDTSPAYKHFIRSAAYQELTQRERDEIRAMMLRRFLGPAGRDAIAADAELTALVGGSG